MRILSILLLACVASPVNGMVYTWKDSSGLIHYTNKDYEIPARYRTKAKALYPDQPDASTPQQNAQPQSSQLTKPAEQPKAQQPVIAPQPPRETQAAPTRRERRSRRVHSSEDE